MPKRMQWLKLLGAEWAAHAPRGAEAGGRAGNLRGEVAIPVGTMTGAGGIRVRGGEVPEHDEHA